MKNSIVFFLKDYEKNKLKNHHSMLYYALETLYKNIISDVEVIVFYDIKDVNEKYNLFKDFKKVNFINLNYKIKEKYQRMFYKWHCVDYLFQNLKYDCCLILDVDVIFYDDLSFIFNKYNDKNIFYCCLENSPKEIKNIINNKNSINGGQILLSRNIYNKIKNIHDNLEKEKDKIENHINNNNYDYCYNWVIDDLIDQYALNNLLCNKNIEIQIFESKDISFGVDASYVNVLNNNIDIKSRTKLLHYFSTFSYIFLPDNMLTNEMKIARNKKINQNKIKEYWK